MRMLIRIAVVVALVMVGTAGCGKPPMQEVGGVVLLDGEPVSNCKVGFFPDVEVFNPDRHGYGFGMTHGDGKFTIVHPQGDVGIWAGKYKVTLVAWVTKDGKMVEPEAKPSEVEGGVLNRFPDEYESPGTTPFSATVTQGAKNYFEYNVKSVPRKESASNETK
jgi:hypothetical protein